jgi:hypothetical protein
MERELSVRQRRFAAGIAGGLSKSGAYLAAYPGINMKKGTLDTAAKKAAKNPRVKAEVERLTLELLPPVEDMRRAYDHAFSTIVRLTIDSTDARLRFDAARWVVAQCEKREELEEKQRVPAGDAVPVNRESIIQELRGLYRKALPERAHEQPLVEVAAIDDRPGVESTERHPEDSWSPNITQAQEESRKMTFPTSKGRGTGYTTVPGHFPPRHKKTPAS